MHRQTISRYDWYEEPHSLIDTEEERARLKVRRIDGVQIDELGEIEKSWRVLYAEDGSIVKEYGWAQEEPPFCCEPDKSQLSLGLD